MIWSKHSSRTLRTQRSAWALRLGDRADQFNDLGPTSVGASVEFLTELAIPVVQDKPRQVVMLNRKIAHLLNHPL